jgi:RNA polymerase sigma-70 factor (ECF subfamily)
VASPLLGEALAASREAWPGVEVSDEDFVAYVTARLAPDVTLDDALRTLCIGDLWLACAIGRGDAAALRAFDAFMTHVGQAIAHLDGGSALVADVTAAVRERVLGANGNGKVGEYRGRGDLRGWLRVIAVREALQIIRARRREQPIVVDLATKIEDPTAPLAPDEQRIYREAFAAALATLTPRERNLLRQQYVYGATIDELGALYNVHRATAARWLAQIRDTLLRRTRRHVGEALQLGGDDLESAMGKLAEHLDYSLRHTFSRE